MEDEIEYRYEKGKGWVAYRKEASDLRTAYVRVTWDEDSRRYVYQIMTTPTDDVL